MQTLQDALWWVVDRLGRWVTAYKPELFCTVPLALIVGGGVYGTAETMQWDVLALLIVLEVMVVIIANPFHCWDRLLAPRSRTLMAAGILIALLPVAYFGMMPEITVILWALAAGLWIVALWRRRLWLGLYRVKQSPDVDTVLSHLSHDRDWQAGRAWEQYGCRETRALLHQAVEAECTEGEMYRTYMPCYLLGFLHGAASVTSKTDNIKKLQTTIDNQAMHMKEQEAEIEKLKSSNEYYREESQKYQNEAWQLSRYAEQLKQKMNHMTLQQGDRDAAILAYIEAGHSQAEAGKEFGLSKSGVSVAVKRARQAEKQDKE